MQAPPFVPSSPSSSPSSSENPARPLLDLPTPLEASASTTISTSHTSVSTVVVVRALLSLNDDIDRQLEDAVHALHLLAAALDVGGAHAGRDRLALFRGDGGEALGLEQVDAGAFGAEVGFQAHEDEGRGGAEVQDFGVPLGREGGKISLLVWGRDVMGML